MAKNRIGFTTDFVLVDNKVGIGTTNPTSKLHVVGDVRVTGVVTATTFVGALTGTASNVTTNANLTGHVTSVGNAAVLGSFSSANLAAALTDETGTGSAVFATNPTFSTSVGIGTIIDIIPYDTLNSGTLSWEGSAGQLFSITNNLTSGSIFSVNDVSGIPSIDVNANGTILLGTYGGNIGIGTTNPVGQLQVSSGPVIIGAETSTGTASQPLQVTGGAYVSGNLGIGTINPTSKLEVNGTIRMSAVPGTNTNAALPVLFQTSAGNIDGGSGLTYNPGADAFSVNGSLLSASAFVGAGNLGTLTCANGSSQYDFRATNDSLRFIAGSSEAGRFDSSGRLLVGTSTSVVGTIGSSGNWSATGQFNSTATSNTPLGLFHWSTYAVDLGGAGGALGNGPDIILARSNTNTQGVHVAVTNNILLGRINFSGSDGTQFINGACIAAAVDGTPGANDMPGRLVFSTTADGTTSPTERMRINSSGQILAGALGTAALPIISFLNDPNTGIFSPGADQLAISTGGSRSLLVSNTQIQSDVSFSVAMGGVGYQTIFRNGANEDNFITHGASGFTAFRNHNGTEYMRLTSAGLLGLGTSSPTALLHCFSPDNINTAAYFRLTNSSAGSGVYRNVHIDGTHPNNASFWKGIDITPSQATTAPMTGIDMSWSQTYAEARGVNINVIKNTHSGGGNVIGVFSRVSTSGVNDRAYEAIGGWFITDKETGALDPYTSYTLKVENRSTTGTTNLVSFYTDSTTQRGSIYYDRVNNALTLSGNNAFRIDSNGSPRLFISSSGNVGIGITTPDALLTVNGIGAFGAGAVTTPSIAATGDLNTGFWFPAADTIASSTGGSERLRIDSSGRLLVGTSTSPSAGELLKVQKASTGTEGAGINLNGAYSLADDASQTISIIHGGLLMITENTNGKAGLLFATYLSSTITIVSDPSNIFATSDTDTKLCVFKSSNTSSITIKNRLGGTFEIGVGKITNA